MLIIWLTLVTNLQYKLIEKIRKIYGVFSLLFVMLNLCSMDHNLDEPHFISFWQVSILFWGFFFFF